MWKQLFCGMCTLAAGGWLAAQNTDQAAPTPRPSAQIPAAPLYKLDDAFLEWPLASPDKAYSAIDGHRIHTYVEDLTAISRKYRDNGHPQFWGRIIGTQADTDTRDWLVEKFTKLGLSDVHIQPFDLPPQWMPQSWEIVASGSGKTLHLDTAQPAYQTKGTSGDGLDLEAVYAGTGSEADFAGRDVRGKAVFIFSMPLPGSWRHTATAEGALRRAEAKGAAAIFAIIALPGNIRTQLYPTGTNVPTFSMGMDDGYAIRDLIGQAGGQPPHVHVRLDIKMEPGLKTGTVWATLPGATSETVHILAHRDGWFESGTDNASGVATMVGLADYFSKIPKEKRRRTIVFMGSTGHHNGGNMSGTWLLDHHEEVFAKSALLINCEHTSTIQTYLLGEDIRKANMYTGMLWYAGGPRRPKLQDIAVKAFRSAGVVTYATPERAAPGGEMSRLWPFVPGVQASDYNVFFHSDHEGPDTVPWTGLEAITRAYAMIIDGVNTLDLSDLQRPPENPPAPRATR
jgi:Peptidase family M28